MKGDLGEALLVCHFGEKTLKLSLPFPEGRWDKRLDSAEARWGGPGSQAPAAIEADGGETALSLSPYSILLYLRKEPSV